jgi:hypothetical protein
MEAKDTTNFKDAEVYKPKANNTNRHQPNEPRGQYEQWEVAPNAFDPKISRPSAPVEQLQLDDAVGVPAGDQEPCVALEKKLAWKDYEVAKLSTKLFLIGCRKRSLKGRWAPPARYYERHSRGSYGEGQEDGLGIVVSQSGEL